MMKKVILSLMTLVAAIALVSCANPAGAAKSTATVNPTYQSALFTGANVTGTPITAATDKVAFDVVAGALVGNTFTLTPKAAATGTFTFTKNARWTCDLPSIITVGVPNASGVTTFTMAAPGSTGAALVKGLKPVLTWRDDSIGQSGIVTLTMK